MNNLKYFPLMIIVAFITKKRNFFEMKGVAHIEGAVHETSTVMIQIHFR